MSSVTYDANLDKLDSALFEGKVLALEAGGRYEVITQEDNYAQVSAAGIGFVDENNSFLFHPWAHIRFVRIDEPDE